MNRQTAVYTPLGENKLLLRRFSYNEQLGRLFSVDVELLSEDGQIEFEKLVGEKITISLRSANNTERFFSGFVSSLTQTEPIGRWARYQATVVPWLWFLTRTTDCRIFQEKTIPEIVKEVFKANDFSDLKDDLKGKYKPWTYCVQYRESDFNFVSRLMEQEGIYYYWKHEKDKHTLVLVDDPTAHDPYPGYAKIKYRPAHGGYSGEEEVQDWTIRKEVQPSIFATTDYNFETPVSSLLANSVLERKHAGPKLEVYDYPGEYDEHSEGQDYSKVRIQELQAQYEVFQASSDSRGISSGCVIELLEHPRKDQNRSYLVTSAFYTVESEQYEAGSGGSLRVRCSLRGVESQTHFRSVRITPKPIVQGPQTAVVVGPKGDEIYVDKHGRVKVQFHWDRYGKKDQNSSCWIRVSQGWAGKGYRAICTPRIGQEVIVEFLEGDPDLPIITGRVYNGVNGTPYKLPDFKTMSTLKSNSSQGGQGFNELRFEDKKGEEQVFLHGEKNLDIRIKNDAFEWIGNSRHLIVKKDQIEHVENNREEKVDADHKEKIGKDRHLKIDGKEAKEVGESHSFVVKGDVIEVFKKNHSEQTSEDYYLKASNIVIEATSNITIKVGGSHIAIEASGIKIGTSGELKVESTGPAEIKATAPLKLESAATADLKSSMTSVKGDGMVIIQGGLVKIN